MPVIYSSLASGVDFQTYDKHPRVGTVQRTITVEGGAGVQNKRTMITPRGAATVVSAEELKILLADPHFKKFVENGFMHVDEKATRKPGEEEIEEVVDEELDENDMSAQHTAKDYEKMGKKAPKVDKED